MTCLARLSSHRHVPLWLGVLAMLLSAPSLGFGLATDDHLMRWAVGHGSPAWDLFHVDAGLLDVRRASGYFPWWTSADHAIAFFRPLSSLSHTLDYTFYPALPWLMHAWNLLLYGGIVTLASVLYRRLLPEKTALLASVMFALEEGHAVSVGWIAGRNTLLAMFFSLLALFFHTQGNEPRRRIYRNSALVLALLSGEAGLWALAFLLAAALAERSSPLRSRLGSIAFPLALTLAWAVAYAALDRGAHGSAWYRELGSLHALAQAIADLPVWIAGLVGPPGMSLAVLVEPVRARLYALPVALVFTAMVWPAIRASEHRFWTLLTLLALGPVSFTVPGARLLFAASFGACALIAIAARAVHETRGDRARRGTLLFIHAALPLVTFHSALHTTEALESGVQKLARAAGSAREVVMLRSPLAILPSWALCLEEHCGLAPERRSLHQLYSGGSPLKLTRVAANVLELDVLQGFHATPMEGVFSRRDELAACSQLGLASSAATAPSQDAPPRELHTRDVVGSRSEESCERALPAFRARVLATTNDGRVRRVRFTFPSSLDASGRVFLTWEGNQPVAWKPPAVGASAELAALSIAGAFAP